MKTWDNDDNPLIHSLLWIRPPILTQTGTIQCAYYMLLNMMHYFQARQHDVDVILAWGSGIKGKTQRNYR
jgi:hypothetical protein